MRTKKAKVTRTQIKKILQESHAEKKKLSIECGDDVVEFDVTPTLSLPNYILFVNAVTENVFVKTTNEETMHDECVYIPQYLHVAIDNAVIAYYTNLDMNITPEELFALSNQTDILTCIKSSVDCRQFSQLLVDIDMLIEHKKQEYAKSSPFSSLINIVSLLTKDIGNKIESSEHFRAALTEIPDLIESISNETKN